MGYTKRVTYTFEAGGETWEIDGWNDDWVEISETSKNGQEDTHCSATLEFKDGIWEMDEWCRKQLDMYWYGYTADEIIKYITENGLPE